MQLASTVRTLFTDVRSLGKGMSGFVKIASIAVFGIAFNGGFATGLAMLGLGGLPWLIMLALFIAANLVFVRAVSALVNTHV